MKIGVIGFGNLAKALLTGILKSGKITENDITVTAKSHESLCKASFCGYNATDSVPAIFSCDVVILAVKPAVFKTLIPLIPTNFVGKIVSTMACFSLLELKNVFKNNAVIRIMPSLLSNGGNDLISVCGDVESFTNFMPILNGAGKVVVSSEEKFNAYLVALSCGVGFSAYITESYKKAILNLGFTSSEANEITATLFSNVASESDRVALYNKVATKGGVTELGLNEFENDNLNEVIKNAVLKSYDKVNGKN